MVKELLANFENEIDSSIQVEESEKEVVRIFNQFIN